jgi:uncharacterized protein (TIGR03086 family)
MTQSTVDPTPEGARVEGGIAAHHDAAAGWFGRLVHQIRPDQWSAPTPCSEWNVRDLVNHVTGEALWTAPLMAGSTISEVGDRFDGDVLGANPVDAWDAAAARARTAVAAPDALRRTVHLSFGDTPATEYVSQLFADHLVHGWDLAEAIGADTRMDPDLVSACATWFDTVESLYRDAGGIGPRAPVDPGADAQTVLLARFGRSVTLAVVERFNAAFARRDVDGIMSLMTDDCVFESTDPAPDGRRFEGQAAVRRCWEDLFALTPSARIESEETLAAAGGAVVRWTYHWDGGHVRGVDVLRVRDGRIAEKLSYVKG